jgi:competence protein ComGC
MKMACPRTTALVVAILLALTVVPNARAEDPVVYTRVAQWQIARPSWAAYEADLKKTQVPVMEKLLADGVITEFGFDRNSVHSPDGYTHSSWFCAKSQADLEKALDAIVATEDKLTPDQRRRQDTEFSGTKHADQILRSVVFRNRTLKTDKGYITVSVQKVLPGKGEEHQALWDKYTKPVLEQLYAEGVVTGYGIDAELVHTGDPALRFFWTLVPDAAALDKIDAAFAADRAKRSPEERRAVGRSFAELRDPAAHRDSMSSLIHYSAK